MSDIYLLVVCINNRKIDFGFKASLQIMSIFNLMILLHSEEIENKEQIQTVFLFIQTFYVKRLENEILAVQHYDSKFNIN